MRGGCQQGSKAQSSSEGHVITSVVSGDKRTLGVWRPPMLCLRTPWFPRIKGRMQITACAPSTWSGETAPGPYLQAYSQFNLNPEVLFCSLYWSLEHSQL